jgi:hypothetical protein
LKLSANIAEFDEIARKHCSEKNERVSLMILYFLAEFRRQKKSFNLGFMDLINDLRE